MNISCPTGTDFLRLCEEERLSGKAKKQEPFPMFKVPLPELPPDWIWASLSKVCERVSVGHVGKTSPYFVENDGVPFIRSQDVRPGRLMLENTAQISWEFHQKLTKSQLKSGDILIVRVGANRGDVCVVPNSVGTINCANIVFARPMFPNGFLGYYLQSYLGHELLLSMTTGSAQGVINTHMIARMPVPISPLPTQRKIAAILSAYDDLIENNTRRIALLEQTAQLLYREWFVHFRFPGHESVPLVESELGPVPKGWATKRLRDICELVNYGYTAKAQRDTVGPKFLRITDIVPHVIDWGSVPYCEIERKKLDKYRLEEGDIVIARTGATTGYAKRINKLHPESVFASYLVRIRIREEYSNYHIGLLVESDEYKRFIKANISGAAPPNANAQVLTSLPVLMPPKTLRDTFDSLVKDTFDQRELLQIKNANLRQTRDLLLPRLISGQLDVSELEINGVPQE